MNQKSIETQLNDKEGYDLVLNSGKGTIRLEGGDKAQSKKFWTLLGAIAKKTLEYLETPEQEPGVIGKLKQ